MTAAPDTPDVVTPPPGHLRFPHMDGLRGLAAVAVIGTHVLVFEPSPLDRWWTPVVAGGNAAVTLFFFISGFLLYRPFVVARLGLGPDPGVLRYLRRRALRVGPAYWLAITVLALYPGLTGVFGDDWWIYYSFLEIYLDAGDGGLRQAWSLCVEVAFYAALPLYVLGLRALARLGRAPSLELELCCLTAAIAVLLAARGPGGSTWVICGMALAVASVHVAISSPGPRAVRRIARHPGWCWCAGLSVYAAGTYLAGAREPLALTLYAVACALLIAPAVFPADGEGWPRRLLAHRFVAWLGVVSYGIYLWHTGPLELLGELGVAASSELGFALKATLVMALTLPLAAASYYFLERPLLRLKDSRPAAGRSQPVPAVVPVPLASADR